MEARWKIINEYPNYKISNDGRVLSIARKQYLYQMTGIEERLKQYIDLLLRLL